MVLENPNCSAIFCTGILSSLYKGSAAYTFLLADWDNPLGRPPILLPVPIGKRGVGFENRQDFLGHKSHRITTHYSTAEISQLLAATNKVCAGHSTPLLTLVKNRTPT